MLNWIPDIISSSQGARFKEQPCCFSSQTCFTYVGYPLYYKELAWLLFQFALFFISSLIVFWHETDIQPNHIAPPFMI